MIPVSKLFSKFFRWLTKNFWLKAVALGSSLLFFFLLRGTEDAQRSFVVDVITLTPKAQAKLLVSDLPDQIKVTLKGSRSLINTLRRDDIPPLQLDLKQTKGNRFYIEDGMFELPAGVKIVQIEPQSIALRWEKALERTLEVKLMTEGAPAIGLSLLPPKIFPSQVRIRGPESVVLPLTHIQTDILDLRNYPEGSHAIPIALMNLPPHTTYLTEDHGTARFEVVPERLEKNLGAIDIAVVGGVARPLRPGRTRIRLQGTKENLSALDASDITPTVDISHVDFTRGAVTVPIVVRGLPPGITLSSMVPTEVLVMPRSPRK